VVLFVSYAVVLNGCAIFGFGANSAKKQEQLLAAQKAELAAFINETIDASPASNAQWGVSVYNLDTGEFLYERQARTLYKPASVVKLFTTAYALETLGADYTMESEHGPAFISEPTDDATSGTLYYTIHGRFFPLDKWNHMSGILVRAKREPLFAGLPMSVVLDLTAGEREQVPAGWEAIDAGQPYATRPGPLVFQVDDKPGIAGLREEDDPLLQTVIIVRRVAEVQKIDLRDIFVVTNQRVVRFGPDGESRAALPEEAPAIQRALTEKLKVNSRPTPDLVTFLALINKRSLNFYAEMLLRHTAWVEGGKQPGGGAQKRALVGLLRYVERTLGAEARGFHVADGSGLSWHNMMSPHQAVLLLQHLFRSEHAVNFRRTLPISGIDGTLEHRLRKGRSRGNIYAKTGYLPGTRTLAGYLTTAKGERLAVAFFTNNYAVPTRRINRLHEAILNRLIMWGSLPEAEQEQVSGSSSMLMDAGLPVAAELLLDSAL
jgi:D-alanyl-D-alanine carboxypeptidase/D-alanyl-D-alanine-endopeptidase (penicillin-binding protein 4)